MTAKTPEQIRESYLSFFEQREHTRYPSDGLVPENDPTLLFTGAGMNQFKAMFLGKGHLPFTRATTSQKCMRMPDLENVGRTSSHHTFFEMLGNFSFGDYFKAEAIRWAWELLTEVWEVPGDRLSVTVYKDDNEAAAIWRDEVGLPEERISRYDEDENFWPASAPSKGPNGICGPCSEIYFDFHPERGAYPAGGPADDGSRFVEIWNLVFTQFDRQGDGSLAPLPQKNIDTGMGFERVVRVLESLARGEVLSSNFESQLFAPLMDAAYSHIGKQTPFGTPDGTRVRRIVDHVRAATFCISDGIAPSNLKQGYVVRKVLRRAMIDRHILGADLRENWLADLAGLVVDEMGRAYPALAEARSMISSTVAAEEEKFASTFFSASQRLDVLATKTVDRGETRLSGADAFLLYDTFGLPLDLQKMLLEERELPVDEDGYRAAMAGQRSRSREASKISDSIIGGLIASLGSPLPQTEFVRDTLSVADAQILDVAEDAETDTDEQDDEGLLLVLDRTPFYAEGGGQVGDTGIIRGEGFVAEVIDTVSVQGITVHRVIAAEGRPSKGPCSARVDAVSREATARNHTATHLLHAALRAVLGDEVTQAGSLVAPQRLRFDFRFPRALTAEEVRAVEDTVNRWILANEEVSTEDMSRDAAREAGAMALFGEKYGESVRVVRVSNQRHGEDSVELCGGTHVIRSGDIGLFRLVDESSIAAGVRRVEARTGLGFVDLAREQDQRLQRSAALFKTSPELLTERIEALQAETKELRRELDGVRSDMAAERLDQGLRDWNGLRVLLASVSGVPVKKLREVAGDFVADRCDLVILAAPDDGGTSFLVAAGKLAQERGLKANDLVKSLGAAFGGKGGGNKAFAQGRGGAASDPEATLEAVLKEASLANS